MVKAVLDTNVFIAGLLTKGVCRSIFLSIRKNDFQLIISPTILDEICNVLNRPKFKYLIGRKDIIELIIFLQTYATFIKPNITISKCRDPEDNHFLATAVASGANFLVTGDKDLLVLKSISSTSIITPSKFKKSLKEKP